MARAIWRGQIAFGLVSVPGLHGAEQRTDISFRLLDSRDKARIRYQRVNDVTGEEVPWDKVAKGYEYADDTYAVVSEAEMKQAAPEATQTVQIEDFVDEGAIDPIYYDKPYYLVPEKRGGRGYALLRETMRRAKAVGIARVVIRSRESLAALRVRDDILVLDLLRFHQELKSTDGFELPSRDLALAKISKKEIDMATRLVESMRTKWKPEAYRDEFRATLIEWIQRKAEAADDEEAAPEEKPSAPRGRVVQFVDLLERSLAARRNGGTHERPAASRPGIRLAGRRSPARPVKARRARA